MAAATAATLLIERFGAQRIVFTGVAGGLHAGVEVGDLVLGSSYVQHDMDVSPLFPRFVLPSKGKALLNADVALIASLLIAAKVIYTPASGEYEGKNVLKNSIHQGLIASGDRFVSSLAEVQSLRAALPDTDPLAPLVRALDSGDSIVIFPEGTRGHGDEPQAFKSGLFKLAQMFPQVVLVPAWINNVQRVMPKGEVVPVPILCSVTFGAPIALEEGEERRPFLDRARRAVIALREV